MRVGPDWRSGMSTSTFDLTGDASERYERFVAPVMASFVDHAVERAAVGPGSSLLDVACGTGFVARRASAVVGDSGRVVGLDLNAGMLSMARRATIDLPFRFEWAEASAQQIPYESGEFDAVICQQGLQFLPDRTAAIAEMARVLRPGGRLVVTFFTPLGGQPYFRAQLAALERLLGNAYLTHAFACSSDEVAAEFTSAGLEDVEVEEFVGELLTPPTLAEFLWGHALSLPAAPALAQLTTEQRDAFITDM
ncbi:MAG: methyltransferase domain-containing protein, partial [Chloroflexi bacterium]|nr:methyltransferase domain-containing protein [Chloroflexota bacterium]